MKQDYPYAHQKLLVTVTDAATGEGRLVSPKTNHGVLTALEMSSSISGPFSGEVPGDINDLDNPTATPEKYGVDGGFTLPFPIEEIVEHLKKTGERPTHVFALTGRPRDLAEPTGVAKWLGDKALDHVRPHLVDLQKSGGKKFDDSIKWLRQSGIPYTLIWNTEKDPSLLTNNRHVVDASISRALLGTRAIYAEHVRSRDRARQLESETPHS